MDGWMDGARDQPVFPTRSYNSGRTTFSILYDDDDFEKGVELKNINYFGPPREIIKATESEVENYGKPIGKDEIIRPGLLCDLPCLALPLIG